MSEPPRSLLEALFLASSQKPVNEAVEQVKRLSPQQQVDYILESLPALSDRTNQSMCSALCNAVEPIRALLRRKLPIAPEQVVKMVELGADPSYYFPFSSVLRLAESIPMGPALAEALRRMRGCYVLRNDMVEGHSAIKARIDDLLHPKEAGAPFETAGPWSRQVAVEATPAWRRVLEAGHEISGREPARKWREAASARVVAIGREQFRMTALRWLELGPSPGEPNVQTSTRESDYQRGLLWSLTQFADAEMAATVARFAEKCLRKIPSLGAVSQRSGNASVGVLAAMGGPESVAQLARLALRIRYHTARRLVQEALEEAARRQGLSREELEEITVPTFGLDGAGRRVERCGECFLVLNAGGELTYERADGAALKSPPEAVKRDFAEDLKEMKQAAKEIGSAAAGASRPAGAAVAHRARHSVGNLALGVRRSSPGRQPGPPADLAILLRRDGHLARRLPGGLGRSGNRTRGSGTALASDSFRCADGIELALLPGGSPRAAAVQAGPPRSLSDHRCGAGQRIA